MTSLFRPQASFLQNTAWQHQAKNALHYNTSQQGSVIPLIYGTMRQQVNLIDLDNYRGPTGKKGKSGSLPLSGTSQSGKGGGSSKGKGSKKNSDYSVDVDFAICQGPVTFNSSNLIFSSAGVESFGASGLGFYPGSDGQLADLHFNKVAYSGTCHIVGAPMDLGQSPVLPNVAVEITGILTGVNVGGYPKDANPGDIVLDFLTNRRYGAGFPPECVSQINHDDTLSITDTYGDYCRAAGLMVSTSLDGHQKAIEWLNGLIVLTNSTLVWSGRLLKIVPYGDLQLVNNGMVWSPYFTPKYDLNDDHFLRHIGQEGGTPTPGDDDPIMITRSNPADADNWISIEYTDRANFYNSTTITAFDQGAIDTYGLRIGDSLPGRAFANKDSAKTSLQLILQRRLYIRNTQVKFQLGWQFGLLEPMDIVSITGHAGDDYLDHQPVRITSIEENDNGDLTVTAEDPQVGAGAPAGFAPALEAARFEGHSSYLWRGEPTSSSRGTLSLWVNLDTRPENPYVLIRTDPDPEQFAIRIETDLSLSFMVDGVYLFRSLPDVIPITNTWYHLLVVWELASLQGILFWLNNMEIENTVARTEDMPKTIRYEFMVAYEGFVGETNYFWWSNSRAIFNPIRFMNINGTPKDLGLRGENIISTLPNLFLRWASLGGNPEHPNLSALGDTPGPSVQTLF